MHRTDISPWTHSHVLEHEGAAGQRNMIRVVVITSAMMVVEIVTGLLFNSMALLADGWHMSTHAAALGMASVAYALSRRHANDARYSFGAWKIEALGGFANAVVLAVVALLMAAESASRFFRPHSIQYDQALLVAGVGLGVNIACALLLKEKDDLHAHGDEAPQHHSDPNLKSAYAHVVTDALTSVFAMVALTGGKWLGASWLDPAMGIVGAVLVGAWSYSLIRGASRVLLDREMDLPLVAEIRRTVESDGDSRVTDLHLIRIGRRRFACVLAVVTALEKSAEDYRAGLREHAELVHVTVEVARCAERVATI